MAALPEDDGPTMTGAPGERRVDHALPPPIEASDGDDTTTAEAGPPAARRDDTSADSDDTGAHDPHDHEDRTVQQKVDPPHAARKPSGLSQRAAVPAVAKPPSAPPPRAPTPVPAAGAPPSALPPSTEPDAGVSTAPAARAITQTTEIESDITADLDDQSDDDDEPIEDSITATAPRLNHANLMDAAQSGHGVPIELPGSVEIRTVEHDDLLDETEIRTRPGHSPLNIPETLRGSPAPMHGSSQPLPPPRPAAGRPPDIAPDTEDDDDDDGVTAQALAPAHRGPDTAPQSRPPLTQASASPSAARAASPRPAAGMPFQPDVVDDPPTRPGVEGAVDEAEEPATRPGVEGAGEPATRPGVEGTDEPPTRPGLGEPPTRSDASSSYANEDDEDESVTTRAPVAEYDENDESVTTQAPNVPPSMIAAAIKSIKPTLKGIAIASLDDGTDGTTQKVHKTREGAAVSPADGEAESITTQAPGLTNILRVIASGSSPSLGSDPALPLLDEDEQPENRTAVMVNAPLKRIVAEHKSASALPAIRPTGGPIIHGPQGSAAPRLEPSSESGLRVARAGGVDRASLGVLGIAGDANARNSGVGRTASARASDGSVSAAPLDRDRAQMNGEQGHFLGQAQPSVHDVDLGKGPRYGLLVAIVAVISIIVPVTLFIALHHPAEALVPGVPAEPASEIEKHDGARVKAVRGKNGQLTAPSASVAASASAAPSAAASTKPGAKGFPFRR